MSKISLDNEALDRLRKSLEQHLDWGAASDWHSSMFGELSQKIFDQCHIMLSPTTLKRFFGVVNYSGQPSIKTLDALAQFLGYENWRDFKLSGEKPEENVEQRKRPRLSISKKSLYMAIGFCIALFTIMLISSKQSEAPLKLEALSFSSRSLSTSYPNSVVFDFDLKNVRSDNLRIQQYWDTSKTIAIDHDQQQATGIYYFPGYFRAKLIIDEQVVKEHDLFLRSNGWMGTIAYEPVPKYFWPLPLDSLGLTYPPSIYTEIQASKEPLNTTYHYVDDLGKVSGDHFSLQSSLRTTFNERWAVCQAARIYILGTQGAMVLPFSKLGCSSDNFLKLNDRILNGKKQDLSAFSADLSTFTTINITVEDQQVTVMINGKSVYQDRYTQSMGRLVGLRYKFLGMGEVASFTLKDQKGQRVTLR
ncbi:MAG: hypothetical protein AAGG75_10500 [Bacteroidota bacterium]